jgi:hypothetical protein
VTADYTDGHGLKSKSIKHLSVCIREIRGSNAFFLPPRLPRRTGAGKNIRKICCVLMKILFAERALNADSICDDTRIVTANFSLRFPTSHVTPTSSRC